ncbi:MAG: FAD binding domain-containing protein [Acidobacteria bacterium]|nr:FAD binding domain-containing protein [Acidobacteriota bacterium]
MMRAGRFRYVVAKSAAEAAQALADGGGKAMLLAGGTDLVPNMKRRQQMPEIVVSLRQVAELREVAMNGETAIGAGVTLADVVRDPRLRQHGALFRAVAQVATPLIRNTATLGGNLCLDTRCNYYDQNYEWRRAIDFCKKAPGPEAVAIDAVADDGDGTCWVAPSSARCWAVSSTDSAPALIALGARVTLLSSRDGAREIPLEALFHDDGMHYMTKRADEVLTRVRVPHDGVRSTYWKLRRRGAFDFPALGVAAAVRFGTAGVVEHARVVLGAVASKPLLLPESSLLVGRALTDDAIAEFVDATARWAKPLDNTDFLMTWRKQVSKLFLGGVLRELRGDDVQTFPLLARRAATLRNPVW